MKRRLLGQTLVLLAMLWLSACAKPSIYHWGTYEDSLYKRYLDASESGRAEAFKMLEATIQEAETENTKVPPGVYADYGYLLFKQGQVDAAMMAIRKEGELYQESKHLMDTMISRIEKRQAEREQGP